MSFLKKIFGGNDDKSKPDIDALLASDDLHNSIMQLHAHFGVLCSYGDKMEALSGPQQVFYLIQELEREINNGGFHQYFFNFIGAFTHETLQSLKAIGANKTAAILQLAVNQFPKAQVPKDRNERQDVLGKIADVADNVFEELDNHFYAYPDNLTELSMDYIKLNKASFY